MLERLSIMDDPSSPLELGDGEGDESEDTMHVSEARQHLYDAIENWERKDANMSKFLSPKHGYHANETASLAPTEWSTTQQGYLMRVEVSYRTGANELVKFHEDVVPWLAEETLQEMLARKSITYPK